MLQLIALSALLLLVNQAIGQSCDGKCCPYGKLKVQGTNLVGSSGQPVQLRGMSLHWSSFPEGKPFFNEETVKCLKSSWNADIVRATTGVENVSGFDPGYLDNPGAEMAKIKAVVQAAIKNCMYVLVDFHAHQAHPDQAKTFFKEISAMCAGKCNCLYETWNEPTGESWSGAIKPYHEQVISEIRKNDPDGVVIAGTPTWDQDVDVAARDKLSDKNTLLTLHFYAGSHRDSLRTKAKAALDAGAGLFVSEYGTTPADGNGSPDLTETQKWYDFLDQNKISYINWAISTKAEGSNALGPGATPADVCSGAKDSQSGQFVKKMMKQKNPNPDKCSAGGNTGGGGGGGGGGPTTTTTTTTPKPNPGGGGGGGGGSSSVSAQAVQVSSWGSGGQYSLKFTNTGSSAVCGVTFSLSNGETIQSKWNMEDAGNGQYKLPSWARINPGASFDSPGMVVSGTTAPKPTVVSVQNC